MGEPAGGMVRPEGPAAAADPPPVAPDALPPAARGAVALVERAIADGTAEAMAQTTAQLIRRDLPPLARIACAHAFAAAERGEEALAVLLADPAPLGRPPVMPVLDAIVQIQGLPRPVAALAWHLRRRLWAMGWRRQAGPASTEDDLESSGSSEAEPSTAPARILYEDEHILVVHRFGASPFTLVTFGGVGQRPSGTGIWAERPVDALGLDAIGFLGKAPNWYPAESMQRAAPAVRAAAQARAYGYGYSMGGYAALKYGRLLGLEAALAAAPQISIDPADMPGDLRYRRFFDPALHVGMRVEAADLCGLPVVLADPRFPLDRMHADVPHLAGTVRHVWLPYRRHGAIQPLLGTPVFEAVLDRLRAGDVAGIRGLLRARRREARDWHEAMAVAATQRGRTAQAEALWARAAELGAPQAALDELRLRAERDRDRMFAIRWQPAMLRRLAGRLHAQARAGNWRGVSRTAARLPAPSDMPRAAVAATNAALALGDRQAVADAASMAIAADLPVPTRLVVAERLGATGNGLQALSVLLADPVLARDRDLQARAAPILGRVLRNATLPGAWQVVGGALRRRLIGAAEEDASSPREASPYAFAAAGPAQPPPVQRWVGAAPRLPAHVAAEFRGVLAGPAARLAGSVAPSVQLLRDVFVNDRGQIWGRDGRLHRSLGRPVAEASRAATAAAPELPEAAFGVEPHGNFYHWMIDILTGLAWRLDLGPGGMPVLLRKGAPGFVRESLEIGAGGPVPAAEAGPATLVRRLHLGTGGLRHLDPGGAHAAFIGRFAAAARREAARPAPRLYISRRDSTARKLLNEEELEAALTGRGFLCTTFGGRPFLQQIALLMGAEVIAAPHGAGLSHLLFCDPGRQVFEFMPAATGQLELRACFATISRLRGHRHGIWLEPFNETFGEWRVSPATALPALDRFLAGGGPKAGA